MPGKWAIRWNPETLQVIMGEWQKLRDEGWQSISIRKVLYKLLDLPGWTKGHYDTLCSRLGEWRDNGTIPFGLFADSGGADHIPDARKASSPEEIEEAIEYLRTAIPLRVGPDGFFNVVLLEHAEDVVDIADMLDGACVLSSGGQLRREHLHANFTRIRKLCGDWNAKGIRCLMLVDYDKGGRDIFAAHKRWLKRIFDLDLTMWGVTPAQIRAAGLPVGEDHQFEGWAGRYGHERLRRELREEIGLT